MPIDAFGYILNNPEQLGKQLSSGGNLPDFAKAELLQASVHAGQYEFASHPVTKGAVNALTFIAPGGVSGVMALKNLGARLFTKAAVKGGAKLFGKEIATTTTRMGRDGKAVEIIFKDGSKIDINAARVKQWTPNTHPNAPAGTLQKVKFKNSIPGSKGYKRTPAQSELDFLNSL
jgi:hypothetical protein